MHGILIVWRNIVLMQKILAAMTDVTGESGEFALGPFSMTTALPTVMDLCSPQVRGERYG
jgi:hypothetical protein